MKMCTRAAHLERGVIRYIGNVQEAVESYRREQTAASGEAEKAIQGTSST
jgi:ABC-type polysaccharide/polyol phosphate transport system ATPase subunit